MLLGNFANLMYSNWTNVSLSSSWLHTWWLCFPVSSVLPSHPSLRLRQPRLFLIYGRLWAIISMLLLSMSVWNRLGAILRARDWTGDGGKIYGGTVGWFSGEGEARLRALALPAPLLSLWAPGWEHKFTPRSPANKTHDLYVPKLKVE